MEKLIVDGIQAAGVLAIATFSIATYVSVGRFKDDESKRRSRLYERLDEVKKETEAKFTGKAVCEVLHKQISSDLAEIKADVKQLLKNGD